MNHQQFREILPLLAYDELAEKDKRVLEDHLETCNACRKELAEIQQLHSTLHKPALDPAQDLLIEARHELRNALRKERNKVSFWDRLRERFPVVVPDYAQIASALATLAIGIFVGYIGFGNAARNQVANNQGRPNSSANLIERKDTQITNVKFLDSNAKDGQVEFALDAITPMKIKGNINDPQVQKVLSYALVNEQNPGVRLQAISAFAAPDAKAPDPQVKKALISALKSDDNIGVRKQALEVLQKFPMDEEVKQSFLYVLVHDRNPGMRVAAIKGLESQQQIDKDVVDVLRQKIQSDDNDYIRLKARDVLQEARLKQ
jgi:HEAT repeats/Putative zinc-finger